MSSSETFDSCLRNYSSVFSNPISTTIEMEHNFLNIQEESSLEHKALFGNVRNIHTLGLILKSFSVEYDEGIVIASISTSSTQMFNCDESMGSFYVGTESLMEDPSLAEALLQKMIDVMATHSLPGPLVLLNSISYFINSTIDLTIESSESIEMFINREPLERAIEDDNQQAIKIELILTSMLELVQSLDSHMPVIILTKNSRNNSLTIPRFNYSWVNIKCNELVEQHPHGFYMVDFGGSGVSVYFCCNSVNKTSDYDMPAHVEQAAVNPMLSSMYNIALENEISPNNRRNNESGLLLSSKHQKLIVLIGQKKTIRNYQEDFVREMSAGAFGASKLYLNTVAYIRKVVTIHALTYDISPITCKIYQTGRARQYHYTNSCEPSLDFLPAPVDEVVEDVL